MTWHDGKPVTSADVRYTWKAVMKPENKVGTRYGYDKIAAVDMPDEQTAIVRFKEPFASWGDPVRHRDAQARPGGRGGLQRLASSTSMPIGFGPFKVTENIKGDHVTYEAFDGYQGPSEDRQVVHQLLRQRRRDGPGAEGQRGRPDLGRRRSRTSPELKALESQGITTLVQPAPAPSGTSSMATHTQVPLFADKELRQALSLAVDRKTIVDKLLFGLTTDRARRLGQHALGEHQLKPVEYNPEQAKSSSTARLEARPDGSGSRTASGWRSTTPPPRAPAPRERPAPGPAELQGRRRRDDDQERARRSELFGSYASRRRLGARQLPDGRLVARGSPCRIRTSRPATSARRSPPSRTRPARQSTATRNPRDRHLFGSRPPRARSGEAQGDLLQDPGGLRDEYALIWLYNSTACVGHADRAVKNFDQTVKTPFGGFHWRAEAWDVA